MAPGNHGEPVFADGADRKLFLETLGEACAKTGWRIHAYVLIGNQVKREPDRRQKRWQKRLLRVGVGAEHPKD